MLKRLLLTAIVCLAVALMLPLPASPAQKGRGGGGGNGGGGGGGGGSGGGGDGDSEFDPLLHVIMVEENLDFGAARVAIGADGASSSVVLEPGKRTRLSAYDWSPPNADPDDLDPVQGNWMVYLQYDLKADQASVRVRDLDGTEDFAVPLAAGARDVVWRPMGDWIALTRDPAPGVFGGDFEFVHVEGLGSGAHTLQGGHVVSTSEKVNHISWSPDGNRIAAELMELDTVWVYEFDASAGSLDAEPLAVESLYSAGTFPTSLYEPSWAKQHEDWLIVNAQNDPGSHEIWFLDLAVADRCPAAAVLADPGVNYRPSDWSADDQQIVFSIGVDDGLWVADLIVDDVEMESGITIECVTGAENLSQIGDWMSWRPRWRR